MKKKVFENSQYTMCEGIDIVAFKYVTIYMKEVLDELGR